MRQRTRGIWMHSRERAGFALSRWMGQRVFGTSITPRWEVFPLTVALMVAVAMAGALPLRLLGRVKPAVILRGE